MSVVSARPEIEVGLAVPSEYRVVLNAMPREWFAPEPHLLHLQVAEMFNSNRFLIAQDGDRLAGGVGWQDNIAFGALYAKFIFVTSAYQQRAVATLLMREVLAVAARSGYRRVFQDIPEHSPLQAVADALPGAQTVGHIDGFHEPGVRSLIVAFDAKDYDSLIKEADRRIDSARSRADSTGGLV